MERRAAGALLALAACLACTAAAPTTSNQTTLNLYDGAPEGCYYNFQHYSEGDRIMTNEPCLNCTCHNRMLMCYLRVCPFTKPIGQDCTVEKRADQCCPIVTCPDVPVDLLTSTSTTSPDEYGATGVGKMDKYGCSINGKYLPEGAKVPSSPDKPCEHCYCFRNVTNCIMQECTLHVDGCTPIYHRDACCPVRYSCDHPEDETLMLDDMTTTVRPTPGFLLTTTTSLPVTQMSQDCVHDDQIFTDGALIKTEKACEHCYCMKGDIVCVVQECGTPMENEGKNCSSLPPRDGQCCPDTYICEGDEPSTEIMNETTKESIPTETSTLLPPKRTSIEGSGYRNEPDDTSSLGITTLEPTLEGSGDEFATSKPIDSDNHIKPQVFDENIDTDDSLLYSSSTPLIDLMEETTEPDKGLNTVPLSEDDIMKPLVPARTTSSDRETATVFTTSSLTTEKLETHLGTTTDQVTTTSRIIDDITVNNANTASIHESSTPIYDDKNTHEEDMLHLTTPSEIGDDEKQESFTTPNAGINYEDTTINKIGGGKIDDENIQSESSTVGVFDKVKEEEEENISPELTTMSISTSKYETEIGDVTTGNTMSTTKEQQQFNTGITTVNVLDSDKIDNKPIAREPSIVMLDETTKDEENNKYGTTTEIFSENNTPDPLGDVNKNQDIDSETITESSLDGGETEGISPSKTTMSNALDDSGTEQSYTTPSVLDHTTTDAQETIKADDKDIKSEMTTSQTIEKEMLQPQSTTISASDNAMEDETNTQSETTTKGTMDIDKDGEQIISQSTTESVVDIVKADDKVTPPGDTIVSTVHDNEVEIEQLEPSTISYLENNTKEDDFKPLSEETTVSSLEKAKEHEENQPDSTTKGTSHETQEGEEKIQIELTTSSDLETIQVEDEEKHKFDATTESAIDVDKDGNISQSRATTVMAPDVVKEDQPVVTTVSNIGDIRKDEEVNESEPTTISALGTEKEKEDIKPDSTLVDALDDSISKDQLEVTTESITGDEDNITGKATTPNILEGLEIDEDQKQTTLTTSSSDVKQADELTTVSIIEHDKTDREKIHSETSTISTINDVSEENDSTLTEATTVNILENVSEIENIKEDEITTIMSITKEIGGIDQSETTITSATHDKTQDAEKDYLPSTVSVLDQKDEDNIYQQSTIDPYITRSEQTTSEFNLSEVSSTVASKKIDESESLTTEKALNPETVTEVSDITETTSDTHKLSTDIEPLKETISSTTEIIESSETSSINPIENEIDEDASPLLPPGRIPGEGDCLLNGITYNNESSVPSSNKCQSNCRCFSSIIKCDPIICSQPPENMENCQPMYDSEDSCCPSYVCDQNKETIPPQSHSQMSGTESPIQTTNKICDSEKCHTADEEILKEPAGASDIPELCTGNECARPQPDQNLQLCSGIDCEQSQPSLSTEIPQPCEENECKQETQDIQPCVGENCHAEKPISCDNGDCSPVDSICKGNECQQIPVNVECNGDTCKSTSDEPHKQDTAPNLPSCEDDTCGIKKTPPLTIEDNTCSDENGCKASDDKVQVECAGDSCRRVEISETEHKISNECSGNECVQKETQPDIQDPRITTEINGTPKVQEATTDISYIMTDKNLEEQSPHHEYPSKSDSSDNNDNLSESHLTSPKMDEKTETIAPELTTLAGLAVTESLETSSTMRIHDLPSTIIPEIPITEQDQTDQPKIPAEEEFDSNIKDNAQDVTIEPQNEIEKATLSNVYHNTEKSTESSLSSQPNDVRTTIHDTIDLKGPSHQTTLQEMIQTTPQPDILNLGSIETSTFSRMPDDQEKISTISDFSMDITTSSNESPEREMTVPSSFDNSLNNVEIDTEEPNVMITNLSESTIDSKTTTVPINVKHQEQPMLSTTEAVIITESYPIRQKQPVTTYSETTENVITVSNEEKPGETPELQTTISDVSKIDDTTTHSSLMSDIELTDKTPINENEISHDMPISTDRSVEKETEQDLQKIPTTIPTTKNHESTTDSKIMTDETDKTNLQTSEEPVQATTVIESSTQTLTDVVTSLFDDKQKETTLSQQEISSHTPDMTNDLENRLTTEKTSDSQLPELHTEVSEISPELTTFGPQEVYPGEEEKKDTKIEQPISTTISPEFVMKDKESSTSTKSETTYSEDDTVTTEKTTNNVFEATTEKASDLHIPIDLVTNAPDSYNTVPDESGETTQFFTQEKITKSTPSEIITEATTTSLIIERSSETPKEEKVTSEVESKLPDASDISDASHTSLSPEAFETPTTETVVVDTNLPQDIVKESEKPQEEFSTINPSVTDSIHSMEKITTLSPEHFITSDDKESEPMDVQQEINTGEPPIVDTTIDSKTTIEPNYSIKNEFDSVSTKAPEMVTEMKKIEGSTVITPEETTPYLVELEEHTHKIVDELSTASSSLYDELTTVRSPTDTEFEYDSTKHNIEADAVTTESDLKTAVPIAETSYDIITSSPKGEESFEKSTDKMYTTTKDSSDTEISNKFGTQTTQIDDKKESIDTTMLTPIKATETPPIPEHTEKDESQENITPVPSDMSTSSEEFLNTVPKATTIPDEVSENVTKTNEIPSEATTHSAALETQKPHIPTDELPSPDYEAPAPPSGTSGYGQEPDYVEEDQAFGPGTCRYGGKVYVSAQQIPRDDPCDFCFCFRSDIICLQQSCPPPIQGCHEEPIQGFCCPRYECPVAMATTLNMTTTTTTTTTTLPPHFPTHAYNGSAQRRGCQIKGHIYKVGEVVKASSGPCLHCTCGGDGQMKCDPKVCTPEPMLRQMIAAAVSAKRRR